MDEIFKEVAKLNEISKLQTTDKNNITQTSHIDFSYAP